MPTEERVITFSLDEVQKAVLLTAIQQDHDDLPMGKMLSMSLEGDESTIGVRVEDKEGSVNEFTYDRLFFAQALVLFCQGSGIPLPRNSQKVVNIHEDRITLSMEIG